VPYCLHPDNRNEARCVIDTDGRLVWWDTGLLPLPTALGGRRRGERVGAAQLLADLTHHRRRLDHLTPVDTLLRPAGNERHGQRVPH
jgi:methylaspartate mutase epsilon subunit